MEPVSLIIAALKAGASFVGEKVAGEAVKDAYGALKTRLAARIPKEDLALITPPATGVNRDWETAAANVINKNAAANDPDLVAAAQAVLSQTNQTQSTSGKFNIQATTIGHVFQGDFSTITVESRGKKPKSD